MNLAKKIGAIVSLTIIAILILATLIMVNVDCNYKIKCNDPDKIYVSYSNGSETLVSDDEYKEILNYINNASKENSLTSLFSGNLFSSANITTTSSSGVSLPSTSGYYVVFVYDSPQVLKNGNKDYTDSEGNKYYYKYLTFAITSDDDMVSTSVYITPYYDSNNAVVETKTYTKYYTLTANFSSLYNYLSENF